MSSFLVIPAASGISAGLRLPFQPAFIGLAPWSTRATSRTPVASVLSDVAAGVTGRTARARIGGNR
jgi:hypothetical protein